MKLVLQPSNTTGSVAIQVFNFNFKYLLCDTFGSEKKPHEVPINRIKQQNKTQHKDSFLYSYVVCGMMLRVAVQSMAGKICGTAASVIIYKTK